MQTTDWFSVDKEGLAAILERRGKAWAVLELIQNALDTASPSVDVTLTSVPGAPYAILTVTDTDPDGFKDLAHAYTLFAPSQRAGDAEKRGRFNFGCKMVLALCKHATITSTTGGWRFDGEGRQRLRTKRAAGSEFAGRLRMTRDELAETAARLRLIRPPAGVVLTIDIDGTVQVITHRAPDATFTAALPTETADAEGRLRRTERKTNVSLYHVDDGAAWLYELGLPVMPIDGSWSIDVAQKIPQGMDRDAVTPSYVAKVRGHALNAVADKLSVAELASPWVAAAVTEPTTTAEAATRYLVAKYGDKYVSADPNNPESNREAVAAGYALIHGRAETADAWTTIKRHGLSKPSSALFPPPAASSDFEVITELSPAYAQLVRYSRALAIELLGLVIDVRVIHGPALDCMATWQRSKTRPTLTFNTAHLGPEAKFFDGRPSLMINELLIHEFAHQFGDHLETKFDAAMARLGAAFVDLALRNPAFFEACR
jgi:hypothetical protein